MNLSITTEACGAEYPEQDGIKRKQPAIGAKISKWPCALFGLILVAFHAQSANLLVGGYTLSTYASGLPVNAGSTVIAGMSMDPSTSQIYYMASSGSTLRRLDPSLAVTTLATSSIGYPFVSTDIEYYNGSVFMAFQSVAKYSSTLASSSILTSLPAAYTIESGIAQVGTKLYVTGGATGAGTIVSVDPVTGAQASLPFSVPNNASSLEYDAAHNRLIVAENASNVGNTLFHTIDLASNTLNPSFAGLSGNAFGNFAVDPTGTWIFARAGNVLDRIDIASGTVTPFVNLLADSTGYADSVFGPSSSGPGESLYVADGTSILEINGFAAVPEPSACALAVLGLGALFASRRFHPRRNQ